MNESGGPSAGDLIRRAVHDALACAPDLPDEIAGYRVIALLGHGGMGEVYRAEQRSPRRHVALKVLTGRATDSERSRRFAYEGEFLGRLQHPGIAKIFEAGVAPMPDGARPFIAMELVEHARTITRYAREERLSARERLALIAQVCDAVEHAHQKGLVHRDLKPANVLVGADGRIKVLDFGVARALDADIRLTTLSTGSRRLIGTIAYMSPEQVAGDPSDIDTRSDVYALGVVAYELLTGRLPHDDDGRTPAQMLRAISDEPPARPTSIDRSLRGDIETILLKALEPDRERRYQSAAAFADDIRRFLDDRTILARPPSTAYQLRRFARRNKTLVGGVAGILLALVVGIVATSREAARAQREADTSVELLRMFLDSFSGVPTGWESEPPDTEVLTRLSGEASRLLDNDAPTEARLRDIFGIVFLKLGDLDRAESELSRHLELCETVYGPDAVGTLRAYDLLIDALRAGDKLEEAERLALRALRAAQDADTSPTHPDVARVHALRVLRLRYRLASVRRDLAQVDEAEQLLRSVLAGLEDVLDETPWSPDEHDNVAEVRQALARLLLDQNASPDEAVSLCEQVVLFQDRNDHGSTVHARAELELARACMMTGDKHRAALSLARAEDILAARPEPPSARSRALVEEIRALVLLPTAPLDAARAIALAIELSEQGGIEAWRTAPLRVIAADALTAAGDSEGARTQLGAALASITERFGDDDPRAEALRERLDALAN